MLRNYFLINIILLIIVGFLGFKFYKALTHSLNIPSETAVQQAQKKEKSKVKRKDDNQEEKSFQIITKNDLFRPSRTPVVLNNDSKPAPAKSPPKLFGTVILNESKTAILEDPDTKTTKSYHVNDLIAGFVVSDILKDKVILSRDGDEIEVKLRDEKGIKTRRRPPSTRKVQPRRQPRRRRPIPPPRVRTRELMEQEDVDIEEIEDLMEDMEELE